MALHERIAERLHKDKAELLFTLSKEYNLVLKEHTNDCNVILKSKTIDFFKDYQ